MSHTVAPFIRENPENIATECLLHRYVCVCVCVLKTLEGTLKRRSHNLYVAIVCAYGLVACGECCVCVYSFNGVDDAPHYALCAMLRLALLTSGGSMQVHRLFST